MSLERVILFKVTTTKGIVESSPKGYDYCFKYITEAHAEAHIGTPATEIPPIEITSMEMKMKVVVNSLTNEGEVFSFICEDSARLTKVFNMRDWI